MPWNTAIRAYNWLPNHYYREHAMPAQLAWMFQGFASGKSPGAFLEWLPAWMRPATGGAERADDRPAFTAGVVADVELAFRLDLLSQAALAALGPTRLRRAGAFQKPN